jgi:hypothetical protein
MQNQSQFFNIIPANRRKMSSNKNEKSASKNSNSKGQQDPNSKNPAAGCQARSLSSPHSPAVGNVARGGQEPQPAPFVTAIVSCITKSAKKHKVDVNFHNVVAFANDYASRMPGKMRKFEQSDVEEALAVFQQEYVPAQPQPQPQPAPQPAPQQLQRLTGRERLIGNLTGNGLSVLPPYLQEKIGTFRMMSNCIFHVEGLDDQKLKHLQRSLCKTDKGVLLGVIAISRDYTSGNPKDLKVSLFKQSSKNGGKYTNHDVDSITLVCVICHGTMKRVMCKGDEFVVDKHDQFGSRALYGSGIQEYVQMSAAESSHMEALMKRNDSQVFVPISEECIADKSSRSDACFEAFCRHTMTSQGCVVVPPFSAPTVTKMHASSAEVAGEAPVESRMILCHHGYRVKNFDGKYQPCQDCLRHPGTKPILDGWNEAVGYQQAP